MLYGYMHVYTIQSKTRLLKKFMKDTVPLSESESSELELSSLDEDDET